MQAQEAVVVCGDDPFSHEAQKMQPSISNAFTNNTAIQRVLEKFHLTGRI